jgi:hypothetical protein
MEAVSNSRRARAAVEDLFEVGLHDAPVRFVTSRPRLAQRPINAGCSVPIL